MTYYGEIKITNKEGWTKQVRIEKALLKAGTAKMNDIQFPADKGNGIAPVHFQLVRDAEANQLRLLNLTNDPVLIRQSRNRKVVKIASYGTKTLHDEDVLLLENYTLRFHLQNEYGVDLYRRTEHIGMKLELPAQVLEVGKKIEGRLTIFNLGNAPNCQVEVDLKGLYKQCFSIDPAPVLYPGGEEGLFIAFAHLGTYPEAGEHAVEITVQAPKSYPGELVRISFPMSVQPYYHHQISLEVLEDERAKVDLPNEKTEIEIRLGEIPGEIEEDQLQENIGQITDESDTVIPQPLEPRISAPIDVNPKVLQAEQKWFPEELIFDASENGKDVEMTQDVLEMENSQIEAVGSSEEAPVIHQLSDQALAEEVDLPLETVEEIETPPIAEPLEADLTTDIEEDDDWWSEESEPVPQRAVDPFGGFNRSNRLNRKEDLRNIRVVKAEEVEILDQETTGDNGRKGS